MGAKMRPLGSRKNSVYFLIPLCTLLGACAPDGTPEQAAATPEDNFVESCGACHGTENNGPTIAELRALSSEQLRAGIINHPTAGQIPDRLTAARIDELIKYLEAQ
jgi:mono/diheme cytochrome c family protein